VGENDLALWQLKPGHFGCTGITGNS